MKSGNVMSAASPENVAIDRAFGDFKLFRKVPGTGQTPATQYLDDFEQSVGTAHGFLLFRSTVTLPY